MYIIYQPQIGYARFNVHPDYWVMKPMGPSACQWIIPGTIDPRD